MTNDDPMYVRHLEQALEAAELEIKGLENEARERENLLTQMQEQLNPTHMGEPASCRKQIEELQARIAMQDEALKFYADGCHFIQHQDVWESVSGEPENFLEDESSTATVEDGSIAKHAISADVVVWQEKRDKEVVAKALEEAIQACRDEENRAWALKGTRDWSSYIEGMSDGAGECADRIVELRNRTGEQK